MSCLALSPGISQYFLCGKDDITAPELSALWGSSRHTSGLPGSDGHTLVKLFLCLPFSVCRSLKVGNNASICQTYTFLLMMFFPLFNLSHSALRLLEMVMCGPMLSTSFALLLAKCSFFPAFSPHVLLKLNELPLWNLRVLIWFTAALQLWSHTEYQTFPYTLWYFKIHAKQFQFFHLSGLVFQMFIF